MVGIIDETCVRYPLGSRIKIGDNCGTVKYVGEVGGQSGSWLGIEWDDPKRGKHNGCVDGKRYFQTQHPTAGSFIRAGKLNPFESLEEAARNRYLDYTNNSVDQTLLSETKASLHASFIEIVGMEKLARKQSKFEQLTEISIVGSPVNEAGYLKDFTALSTLNLSRTLISNWKTLAEITQQIPTLNNLNLSSNRLILPNDEQIVDLEPSFRHLQYINLCNCNLNDWQDVMHIARLWPNILSVGLQDNCISELSEVNCKEIFKNLQELDLHRTKIMDFDQICKLGNITTLISLNLMENGIEEIKLPDCELNSKLNIFISLEHLNLLYNPIWNEANAFNELDKLPKLKRLNKTPCLKSNFDEMFSKAIAFISDLEMLNGAQIVAGERRGCEYDIWKQYATEWLNASKSIETLKEFNKKHRSYSNIVKKYGSPIDFIPTTNTPQSKLIKIRIKNIENGEIWEKKVPRLITVQTLLGLIIKRFRLEFSNYDITSAPQLAYIDAKRPELIVPLDNASKTLDFYSVQENDTIFVQ